MFQSFASGDAPGKLPASSHRRAREIRELGCPIPPLAAVIRAVGAPAHNRNTQLASEKRKCRTVGSTPFAYLSTCAMRLSSLPRAPIPRSKRDLLSSRTFYIAFDIARPPGEWAPSDSTYLPAWNHHIGSSPKGNVLLMLSLSHASVHFSGGYT